MTKRSRAHKKTATGTRPAAATNLSPRATPEVYPMRTLSPTKTPHRNGSMMAPSATSTPRDGRWYVSPDIAELWLERNTSNRNFRPTYARQLAREIEGGHWLETHEGIAFSRDGVLLDGQHRLWAIVLSGIGIELNVRVGLDPRVFHVIDTGKPRNSRDVLTLVGTPHPTLVAAILRIESRVNTGNSAPTHRELLELLDDYPGALDAADAIYPYKADLAGWLPMSALGWFDMRAYAAQPTEVEGFIERVATGVNLRPGDAALAFRRRFMGGHTIANRKERDIQLYFLCRAWQAELEGTPMSKLQTPKNGIDIRNLPGPGMAPISK